MGFSALILEKFHMAFWTEKTRHTRKVYLEFVYQ